MELNKLIEGVKGLDVSNLNEKLKQIELDDPQKETLLARNQSYTVDNVYAKDGHIYVDVNVGKLNTQIDFSNIQKEQFKNYTGFDASRINTALRKNTVTEAIQEKINILDNAFKIAKPLEQDTIVYRGGLHTNFTVFENNGSKITEAEMLSLKDRIIEDKAFLSTGKYEPQAMGRNVIMTIH